MDETYMPGLPIAVMAIVGMRYGHQFRQYDFHRLCLARSRFTSNDNGLSTGLRCSQKGNIE